MRLDKKAEGRQTADQHFATNILVEINIDKTINSNSVFRLPIELYVKHYELA